MGANMKTTVEISESLLQDAKALAKREKTTLRALIERGLRGVLAQAGKTTPFVLRDACFTGQGLQPGFEDGDWQRIRDASYDGRGG